MIKKMLIGLGLLATTSLSGCVVYATPPRVSFYSEGAACPVYASYPTVFYFSGFHWGYHGSGGCGR